MRAGDGPSSPVFGSDDANHSAARGAEDASPCQGHSLGALGFFLAGHEAVEGPEAPQHVRRGQEPPGASGKANAAH